MADLQSEAQARLPTLNGPDLLTRLVDELVPELGEGSIVFRVRQGDEKPLAGHLRRSHAGLLPRSTIQASADIDGGVEVSLEGRQRLDNSLRSRLLSAWQQLEPEIAALLFREAAEALPPPGPTRDESVEAAGLVRGGDGAL
jgi:vacuolar-type H+-ATPase subunit E/Vma4